MSAKSEVGEAGAIRHGAIRALIGGAGALAVVWVGVAAGAPWLIDRAAFPGATMRLTQVDRPGDAEQIWLERGDGARLEGWVFRPAGPGPHPVVIYFHGNAELIDHNASLGQAYAAAGFVAVLAEYRGYGRSTGRPTAARLAGDAAAFFDWAANDPHSDAGRISVHGRSLGGAAAGALLNARPVCAAALEHTFTSLADMVAAAGFPRALAGGALDTQAEAAAFAGPLLIMHGRADEVIPYAQGEALATTAAGRPGQTGTAKFISYPGGHGSMAPQAEIVRAVADFLNGDTPCGLTG